MFATWVFGEYNYSASCSDQVANIENPAVIVRWNRDELLYANFKHKYTDYTKGCLLTGGCDLLTGGLPPTSANEINAPSSPFVKYVTCVDDKGKGLPCH